MSPQQRPGRVTPSKKQLAEGSGGKGSKGAKGSRGAKPSTTASSGKGAGAKGSSAAKGSTRGGGDAAEGTKGAGGTRKGRVPEAQAPPVRTGLLSRLVPPRPAPVATRDQGDEAGGEVEVVEAPARPVPDDGRRYGAGAILIVFLAAQFLAAVAYAVLVPNSGYDPGTVTGVGGRVGQASWRVATGVEPLELTQPVPLWMTALVQVPMWATLILGPMWFAWKRGRGVVTDLGLRMKAIDVPVGLAVGAAAQLIMVPALYWVVFKAIGVQDVSAAARAYTDRATDPLSIVLVFLIVGIGAPIAEEIYFRGMALPIFRRRLRARWAILASATFFALTHLQLLQFPALLIFGVILGVMTVRSGRLGPALWAHLGFNVVAAASLLLGVGWF